MIDASNWRSEYEAFLREEQEMLGGKSKVMSWDAPRPRLSQLIECAELARMQPDIWQLAKEKAIKPPKQRDEEDYQLTELCGEFTSWFRFKNEMRDHNFLAFADIQNVLVRWVELGAANLRAAKSCFVENEYIDDMTQSQAGGED